VTSFWRLDIQRDQRRAVGRVEGGIARLLVPRGEDLEEIVVPADLLPAALARLVDLGPRPRPQVQLRLPGARLAELLARGDSGLAATLLHGEASRAALRRLVSGLRAHWRVEAQSPAEESPTGRIVEAIDTDHGLWLVVSGGSDLELVPSTPATIWRELASLVHAQAGA